jgi:hypothetical protein
VEIGRADDLAPTPGHEEDACDDEHGGERAHELHVITGAGLAFCVLDDQPLFALLLGPP